MSASLRWNEIKVGITIFYCLDEGDKVTIKRATVAKRAAMLKGTAIIVSMFSNEGKRAPTFMNNVHHIGSDGKQVDMSEPSGYYYRTAAKAKANMIHRLAQSDSESPTGILTAIDELVAPASKSYPNAVADASQNFKYVRDSAEGQDLRDKLHDFGERQAGFKAENSN